MKLTNLFKDEVFAPQEEIIFQGLTSDSRQVKPGYLFVAISCDEVVLHVAAALEKGAAAVVIEAAVLEQNQSRLLKALYIPVRNARQSLSELAQKFYPQQPQIIAAVTGTNGKSSVATFVRQIWELLGKQAASFGTLGLETVHKLANLPLPKLTTPDAVSLHQLLQRLVAADISHFAFEASSHGLDQYRLHGARVTVAGFTNLSQDHLDYHGTMEAYFEAKSKLFTEVLAPGGVAVINNNSVYAKSLELLIRPRSIKIITYGVELQADLIARNIQLHNSNIKFDLIYNKKTWNKIQVPVVGNFQVENILCAIGMVMAEGIPLESIVPILPQLQSAPGRMQLAGTTREGAAIYVDYAHTPDALTRALIALKPHLAGPGKLHVVFGCGGNRDTGKRNAMGAAADAVADVVYVTDDNPRLEDPSFIRAQVLSGCPKGQEVADRFAAIEMAIQGLRPSDILLVAGKGHETGQVIGPNVIPFDDVQVVRKVLSNKKIWVVR